MSDNGRKVISINPIKRSAEEIVDDLIDMCPDEIIILTMKDGVNEVSYSSGMSRLQSMGAAFAAAMELWSEE